MVESMEGMHGPAIADRQQQVWPLRKHPYSPAQSQLGHVQVLLPDAFVSSMRVQHTEPVQLGFMCGSVPVPTFSPADIAANGNFTMEAALIPAISLQSGRAAAPRYRILPTQTDLNRPPSNRIEMEPILPVATSHEAVGLCNAWGGSYLSQPLARKCEALAVNALAGCGDGIDVVAPIDILKQIFKTPYCKGRLSVAVHRIGQTLVLNSGPDEWRDEMPSEKLGRRKKNNAKAMERSLFSKFVQHSMNGDSCDTSSAPGSHSQGSSSHSGYEELDDQDLARCATSRVTAKHKVKQRVAFGHCRHNRCGGRIAPVKTSTYVGEQQRETEFVQKDCPSEGPQRPPSEGFLRVLFWQFQSLRMLLGSDLLLFSNERHAAVSLHLLEIERQVTPLMWLDAWLDNVMASIPELAVCYHRNGVVQGYELLKTDDILIVKGIAKDGAAFFHPHVVEQNASSVLRFLQENCKEDPGTYWLFKNAGEDLMQLFDLSVISKTCTSCSEKHDKSCGTLPSSRNSGNGHYSLPLAMLLYRLTSRLSRSQDPADRHKCAKLFRKCLEYMDEQEHLVIRASAHEHVARLILTSYKESGSTLQPLLLESITSNDPVVAGVKQPLIELPCPMYKVIGNEVTIPDEDIIGVRMCDGVTSNLLVSETSDVICGLCSETSIAVPKSISSDNLIQSCGNATDSSLLEEVVACTLSSNTQSPVTDPHDVRQSGIPQVVEMKNELGYIPPAHISPTLVGPPTDQVSARLAAVHHISQSIKALRWQRQLQDVADLPVRSESSLPEEVNHVRDRPLCICGEVECDAICDFREIGVGIKMDQKLWRLMLLLGESYLALGQAYKDGGQPSRALKAAELACLVCGSMPQIAENFVGSSNVLKESLGFWRGSDPLPGNLRKKDFNQAREEFLRPSSQAKLIQVKTNSTDSTRTPSPKVIKGPFWGTLWMFVGDVYVDIQRTLGEGDVIIQEQGSQLEELTMTQEVMKEVKRLKKKIGQMKSSCDICSLTSCSCRSDRASSGSSASSSTSNLKYSQKQTKKHCAKAAFDTGSYVSCEKAVPATEADERGFGRCNTSSLQEADKQSKCNNATNKMDNRSNKSIGKDIFSFLRKPVMGDWDGNLSAAVECYNAAVGAFTDLPGYCEDLTLTFRKKGWACNELGRLRLAKGNVKLAEAAFELAIKAFREVKDVTNIVLVYCNLGHGRRAAAETLASKLTAWEECEYLSFCLQTIAEAKFLYGESLKYYGTGRRELMSVGDGVERSMGGLWNELHTQLANTYLRLGMFLAWEDNFVNVHRRKVAEKPTIGSEDAKTKKSGNKDETSVKDAIAKALVLYQSLGEARAQEVAFAQFQLACHHRDRFLLLTGRAEGSVNEKGHSSAMQKAKLHVSLAELYWQKSLDYYQPDSRPDMFLEILMERSALCLVQATALHQHQMVEQALLLLLEGRQALPMPVSSSSELQNKSTAELIPKPSLKVVGKLVQQVQMLLKAMLGAAMMANKPTLASTNLVFKPGQSNDSLSNGESQNVTRIGDVTKLKEMYRQSLTSHQETNLISLYDIWMK